MLYGIWYHIEIYVYIFWHILLLACFLYGFFNKNIFCGAFSAFANFSIFAIFMIFLEG